MPRCTSDRAVGKEALRLTGANAMKYRVVIQQDEDGVFVAEVAGLPGCISQGQTRSEALLNVQEALEAYLESLQAHGRAGSTANRGGSD